MGLKIYLQKIQVLKVNAQHRSNDARCKYSNFKEIEAFTYTGLYATNRGNRFRCEDQELIAVFTTMNF